MQYLILLASGELQRKRHIDTAETTGMPVTKKARNAEDGNTVEIGDADDVVCID